MKGTVKKSASAQGMISVFVYNEPVMDLTADPTTLDLGGSASVQVSITRKGEPVADGIRVDFTETTGLADLSEPSATTSGGTATVTLVARTDPGTAQVHATAAIPVPVPGGSPEDVPVEADIDVEILGCDEWSGTIEWIHDNETGNSFEHAELSVDFNFTIGGEPDDTVREFTGTATATQVVEITPKQGELVMNLNAPTLSLVVWGEVLTSDRSFGMDLEKSDHSFFYSYDLCDTDGTHCLSFDSLMQDIVLWSAPHPLEEGTYTGGITDLWEDSYTITLQSDCN